jgi:hypothetical protein
MDGADGAGIKAAFAITQVVTPHSDKTLIVAQRLHGV